MNTNSTRFELYIQYDPKANVVYRKPYASCETQAKAEYLAKRDLKNKRWFIIKVERTLMTYGNGFVSETVS